MNEFISTIIIMSAVAGVFAIIGIFVAVFEAVTKHDRRSKYPESGYVGSDVKHWYRVNQTQRVYK